ncbi:sigma 54-interacting transcriptional regulator [Methylotenera sp.]|uniref:sigma 54-interacting transcriptional regulator n=1 Tax=Methylotenera sp. TaxID=2051956 RepID=UPI00271D9136|nr:sigma 54-interacting transcriptional regulator [Methylotenera sp.]MDO9205833.1 sigma 54-interacting transcriptional regulator [Methylotenera sp.]MDO9205858.1 sigma 54-interacting transcriptional regulator [Methylotenera sp.]MDP2070174.1 sigma 54-interacting transcriptional regulator [Methylotenera sp.]MDP3006520.1 sigma 54-interacting transcriptional regulator [Methylotenera sp.]
MKKHILVVDDDADILKLLEMRLTASDYQVTIANSAQEAISLFNMRPAALVISDLRMPEMDGFSLFEAIHQLDPTVPFILLTAHGSIPEAVYATQQGVFSFLTKPFDSKVLLQQVATALKITASHSNSPQHNDDIWSSAIICDSQQMQSLLSQAKLVAASDASVLVQGESGTGKELLAQAIHLASPRREKPFVAINCAALPEALLESELFGHSKGAFTGAVRDHQGLIKNAHGGTLFLDEIGDMPLAIQAKLLRALQERVIRPVGSTADIAIDVRVICATHKNLIEEMQANRFREDLYYRINVVSLEIPSLTARREDIPLLANYFLEKLTKKHHRKINGFAPDALELMLAAPWPGNVRQLQNIVEQVVVLSTTPIITGKLIQKALQDNISSIISFDAARKNFEQQYLINLLKATQGNVTQAARIAGRNRTEFYKILQRHHINPSLFKAIHLTE